MSSSFSSYPLSAMMLAPKKITIFTVYFVKDGKEIQIGEAYNKRKALLLCEERNKSEEKQCLILEGSEKQYKNHYMPSRYFRVGQESAIVG